MIGYRIEQTLFHYSHLSARHNECSWRTTLHNNKADLTGVRGRNGIITLVVINLIGTSEHLVVGESLLDLTRLVQTDVARIGNASLIAEIVEVGREILGEVLTIEVFHGRSR